MRRIGSIALLWCGLWLTFMLLFGLGLAVFDPDSIDPGEGPLTFAAIFGPMGFLSGAAFALLLGEPARNAPSRELHATRVALCGFAGSALAQVPYLGHGDQGLLPNLWMAGVFAMFGAVCALTWLALDRWRAAARLVR